MMQSRDLAARFEAYSDWRRRLSAGISGLHEWLSQQELADAHADLSIQHLLERLHQDQLVVTYEKGTLKGQFDPNVEFMGKFALIRIGPDSFVPGIYDEKGVMYEVLRPDLIVEFKRSNGRAASFEMRDDSDSLQGRATRIP